MKKLLSLRNIIPAASVLLQLSTLCFHARGAAGDVDLSFDAGSGINGPVNAVAVLPDGKIIIGGQFTTVKGLARRGVARLHADGSGDGSFDAGSVISSGAHFTHVYAVAPLPDGKVLVGQDLGITRLNADGSRDSSFQLFAVGGDYTWTTALAVQPDGKVLVGGYTVTRTIDPEGYAEYFYNYFLTRVNANGSHDNGFSDTNWGSSSWEYSWINSIVVQSDGRILYGGTFGIVRLHANGSEDSSFDRGGTYGVGAVAVQSDGRVLIGGRFYKVKGADRNAIARLNADGSLDSSFDPGTGVEAVSPVSPLVESVVLQSDGKVLIGGSFSAYNGTSRSGIARLNTDGSLDLSFNPGMGANGTVCPVALQNDGRVLIGGNFSRVDGVVRNRIARLNADGGPDGSFRPGSGDPAVFSLAVQPDGKTLIGGDFSSIQDLNRSGIARLNADGSLDLSFNPGAGVDHNPYWAGVGVPQSTIALQSDGKVLIGGPFSSVDGTPRNGIARLNDDGSLDGGFNANILSGDSDSDSALVSAIAVQPDGKLLIGGVFLAANGTNGQGGIARLNANGSLDASFNPGPSSYVRSIVSQPDGKVLVGGTFYGNGTSWNGISRLNPDGSQDSSFNGGAVVFGYVTSLALQPDGKVLVGGSFSAVNGTNRTAIARLNANGTLDGSFAPEISIVEYSVIRSLVVQPDGKVLIGGAFSTVNGTNRNGIARLHANGSLDLLFNPGSGVSGRDYPVVNAIVVQSDGNLLIGGDFTMVDRVVRSNVARLYGDSLPPLSFAGWAAGFGLSGPAAGSDADPDHDGLPNGVEFVLGDNPRLADASALPTVTLNGGNMLFTFPRDDASESPDVLLTVESGTDLVTWPAVFIIGPTTATSSPGVSIAENGPAPDAITVTIPVGTDQRTFARLKVAIAP